MLNKCIGIVLLIVLTACSERKSDEEMIIEKIDSVSVHLALGMKIITGNPYQNLDITKAQSTLKEIADAAASRDVSESLSFKEIALLAKLGFEAKKLGATELARGKNSDFRYLAFLFANKESPSGTNLTVNQDHALTLAGLYGLKVHPKAPMPISQNILLYEAWMSEGADFDNEYMNTFIHTLQVSTYARNDFCDLAWNKAELMRSGNLDEVDMDSVLSSVSTLFSLPAMAHVPEIAVPLSFVYLLPVAIELFPGAVRIMAHIETSLCFDNRGNDGKALEQQTYAVDAMSKLGIPESELAILKAALSYKNNDLDAAAKHLKNVKNSKLLDDRSKHDILELAQSIDNPDKSLIQKYFSSKYLLFIASNIVTQRLIDEGVFDEVSKLKYFVSFQKILSQVMVIDSDDIMSKGENLLGNILN